MTTHEDCADRSHDGQPADAPAGSEGPPSHEQADVMPRLKDGESSGVDAPTPELAALVEAVLLVADEPVPAGTLAQIVERGTDEVQDALAQLARTYDEQGRGFELREVGGGWRYTTRADCAPWVERFVRDGQQARLTQAALETLAVVAYRQPVTRARVSAVRGVNVDGVVRTLVSRGLLAEAGQDADTGGTLYVTTPLLLQKLGLRSLHDLPSLAPLLPEPSDLEEGWMST
jgi:segregation and condensation protein B